MHKKELIIFAGAIAVLCTVVSCITFEKKQSNAEISGILAEAHKSRKPIYIKTRFNKKPYITKVLSASPSPIIFAKDPEDEQSVNSIECISLLETGHALYYPSSTKQINGSGKTTTTILYLGKIKAVKGGSVSLSPDTVFEVVLIDKSKMIGNVTSMDLENDVMIITTKLTSLTIPADKIASIGKADLRDVVEVILIDGTQRNGYLESDDGKYIILETILGRERYSRDKVLKINYKNK